MTHLKLRSFLFALLFAFITPFLMSCSEDSFSADVDLDPEEGPIAINADLTIGSGDDQQVIEAPWYLFRYTVKNKSSATLYLVTFRLTVTGTKNGISNTKVYDIDPGENCGEGYSRPFLGIINPNTTFTGNELDNSGEPLSRCGLDDPPTDPVPLTSGFEGWYIANLPESDSLIYTIQIEGQGWFEVNGVIKERAYIYGFQVTR